MQVWNIKSRYSCFNWGINALRQVVTGPSLFKGKSNNFFLKVRMCTIDILKTKHIPQKWNNLLVVQIQRHKLRAIQEIWGGKPVWRKRTDDWTVVYLELRVKPLPAPGLPSPGNINYYSAKRFNFTRHDSTYTKL